jgi:hypothetical protein
MPLSDLTQLERHKDRFDPVSAAIKLRLVRALARTRLATSAQVRRLHEVLCFVRAYPDNADLLAAVEAALARFDRRADLRSHRDELAYSGIAGTPLWFPFFYPTARWVARRWPQLLTLDRDDAVAGDSIAAALPALLTRSEAHGVREAHLGGFDALDRVRGRETDAAFLIRRVEALGADERAREMFYDALNPSCLLAPGRDTPTRTRDAAPGVKPVWRVTPLPQQRPDLAAELRTPPATLRRLKPAEAHAVIELARAALATRQRDLDAFAYANERDVWWLADADGLAFALIGVVPSRRAVVPAIYGGLSLQNGVPIGYHQCDVSGAAAALSFNAFDTFRGGATAHVFARWLAALHAMFGTTSFSIEPYQLGDRNDEGLQSGAWWFYAKLGFAPRSAAGRRLAKQELQRQAHSARYRSSVDRLRELAKYHLFFEADRARPAPFATPAAIGLAVARHLTRAAGSDRAAAIGAARVLALRMCGLRALTGFSADERAAWDAWAPLVALLDVARWPRSERAALVRLIRAKAADSEKPYVTAFSALPRLASALARLKP